MKMFRTVMIVASATFIYGCASTTPDELIDARRAYEEASMGPAAQWAPAELHEAKQALVQAENQFAKGGDSYRSVDLAYVAERKAEMAVAQASIKMEQADKADSDTNYTDSQRRLLEKQEKELGRARTNLALSQQSERNMADRLGSEHEARRAAEQRAMNAQIEIAKIGEIEDDSRGTIITLPGSVLFRSNEAYLMPGAQERLDLVIAAINATSDRNVVVEGHSDSQGSDAANFTLTQRRAETIRDYLISRGCAAGLVQARGMGAGHPIADNATAQGRSDNRRFSIIIERSGK